MFLLCVNKHKLNKYGQVIFILKSNEEKTKEKK